jgi:hypothetical protein
MMVMLALSFFSWWYGRGWKQVATSFGPRIHTVADSFSAGQLLRTLFAPWRRIVTPPSAGLSAKLRALVDNLVSRTVGFFVRLIVLLAALVTIIGITLLTAIELIAWPLLPIAVPVLIVKGLV